MELSDCKNLVDLPTELGRLEELKELLDGTAIREIHTFSGSLKKLERRNGKYC